jgi:glycosyltransferase involved in cell wall biosynthesis
MEACRRGPSKDFLPTVNIFSERKASLSSSLKVLQLIQTLDPSVGGVAPAVLALSRGLARRGHQVDIVVLDDAESVAGVADAGPRSTTAATNTNLKIHALGAGVTSYRYSSALTNWLRDRGENYDRVIVNGLWQYMGFAAWRRYARTSTPYYVFPHGMLDPWFKRTFPLKHLKKWLYWPWADYRVLRDAEAVIFTSEEERLQAPESFSLYRCREKVSPLGLESPPPTPPQAREAAFLGLQRPNIFLFLGRLHPKKGCDLLIEALARSQQSQNPSLVLAGPDQIGWQSQLRAKAEHLGIASRVVFTGMLQGAKKQGALASADVFILPSHQENFGMSVVEALAAGLPVLISNRVNIWREIEADHAGYVENDDLAGTTRLIERWLRTPERDREIMRDNARDCFARRYEINRALDSLLSILSASSTDSSPVGRKTRPA